MEAAAVAGPSSSGRRGVTSSAHSLDSSAVRTVELRHLRYFVTVVREGNFTRAAERLHMAQPPLSRQIQQLEDRLGVVLLDRQSRPLQPTEAGRFFYEQAVNVLERVETVVAQTRRYAHAEKRRFGIGFVGSTLYGALPMLLRRFRAAYPQLNVELLELGSVQQVAALKDGRIDVGFGRIPVEDPAIARRLLREESLVVALPPGHPLFERPRLRMSDLADEALIVYPKAPRPSYADHVLALYRDSGVRPSAVCEASSVQTALGLVLAAEGLCVVPEAVQRLRRDDLFFRPLDDARAVSPVILYCRAGDAPPEIAAILELIRAHYREHDIPNALG